MRPPSSRVASFIAEPAPARRAGTADMIAAVMGDIDNAMPPISGTIARAMYQYGVCGVRKRYMNRPRATELMPIETTRLTPKRALRRGVIVETRIMIGAIGSSRSAALSGVYPRISWKYWVMRNITPYIDKKIRIMPHVPVLKAGLRKKRMSSIGSSTRSSHATNRLSATTATANATSVEALPQPSCGASIKPYTSETIPTIESNAPIGSS